MQPFGVKQILNFVSIQFYLQQDRFTWFSGWLYPVVILEVAHKKYHRCKQKERSPLNLRIIRLSRGARCSNATVSGAVQIRGAEGEVANKSRGSFALYRRLTSATRDVTCSTSLCSHLHFVNVIWKSTLPMFNISTTEIAAGLRLEHLLDSRLYMVSVFFFLSSEMRVVFSPLTNSNWPLRVWWYVRNLMFYDLTFSCVTACRKLAHWPQPILDSIGMQNIVAYVLASDKWFLSIYRFVKWKVLYMVRVFFIKYSMTTQAADIQLGYRLRVCKNEVILL